MATTVTVTGLGPDSTKDTIEAFFSFCGAIDQIHLADKSAEVQFATTAGANNALLLDGSQLDGAIIAVKGPAAQAAGAASTSEPATAHEQNTASSTAPSATASELSHDKKVQEIKQEDKPKSALIAEMVAHGYLLSDEVTKRAIDFDTKHGYSSKFTSFLRDLDQSLGQKYPAHIAKTSAGSGTESEGTRDATTGTEGEKSATTSQENPSFVANVQASVQQQLQDPNSLLSRANTVWQGPTVGYAWAKCGHWYNQAANHPTIKNFYDSGSRTIQDVHSQATAIAQQKKSASQSATPEGSTN